MLERLLIVSALWAALGCSKDAPGQAEWAARGKDWLITAETVRSRMAATGHTFCDALQRAVDEELLARDWCSRRHDGQACKKGDREIVLREIVDSELKEPPREEVRQVVAHSPYLRQRDDKHGAFIRTLLTEREAHARLRERARRLRSAERVEVGPACTGRR